MIKKINEFIAYSYYLLLLSVPLAVYPKTSELFEFNKMILTYAFAILIVFLWLIKMTLSGKIVFRKTPLDLFLIIFLLSQLASTIFSLDTRTSLLGYYSRFHGGLTSTLTYLLLYWAYVSNMNREKTEKAFKFMFFSALLVSLWAIFEHFGKSFSCLLFQDFRSFDVSCWVQDVQNRVFATFGQPNWLAAWLVALIPLTWSVALTSKINKQKSKIFYVMGLATLLFLALLFTKSRSGLLGFAVASVAFWGLAISFYYKNTASLNPNKQSVRSFISLFFTINISILLLIAIFGTPWTAKLSELKKDQPVRNEEVVIFQGPALEVGGTESGIIRRIVWRGALDIWKNNPVFGTGVETFAFSYYRHRPAEHNLVSEWNFLYNKAHNEYLNYAATTGTVGLISYLLLIFFSFIQILNPRSSILNKFANFKKQNFLDKHPTDRLEMQDVGYLTAALAAGYISILVTNFFGFSVVAVALLFFLFPAMAVSLTESTSKSEKTDKEIGKLTNPQVFMVAVSFFILIFGLYSVYKYWYADYLYAKGKLENDLGLFNQSRNTILKAIEYSANESVFWDELAESTASLAVYYDENGDAETAQQLAASALNESDKVLSLSPKSVILRKTRVRPLVKLSSIDPNYMYLAKNTLLEAKRLAPTDAHISYNLAITYMRTGDMETFYELIKDTIEMKPNYKEARYALAQYYIYEEKTQSAINELEYILQNIDYSSQIEMEIQELKEKT